MSEPLSQDQRTSLQQAINMMRRLLGCTDGLDVGEFFEGEKQKIKKELQGIQDLLDGDDVDIKSTDENGVQAQTDRNGIHVNDTQEMFDMPGDMHLEDCNEGYFRSAWLIAAMLLHEKYHYDHHSGWFGGGVAAVFNFVGGNTALMIDALVNGTTYRSWKFKEFKAYAWSYSLLGTMLFFLEKICREKPNCIPCCAKHMQWLQDAQARHNPWSTYGA